MLLSTRNYGNLVFILIMEISWKRNNGAFSLGYLIGSCSGNFRGKNVGLDYFTFAFEVMLASCVWVFFIS